MGVRPVCRSGLGHPLWGDRPHDRRNPCTMSFLESLASLWQNLLQSLGLAAMERTVVFLGLDNAGKTTLLHKLKHGSVRQFVPTERAMNEEVMVGKLTLRAWDLGGHDAVRKLWKDYYATADGVVFLVDASERERFPEAMQELHGVLADPETADVPLVVLGNKSDIQGSAALDELIAGLQLQDYLARRNNIQVYRSS